MGKSRRSTPETSSITRARPLAYSRRQQKPSEPEQPSKAAAEPSKTAAEPSKTAAEPSKTAAVAPPPPSEKAVQAVAAGAASVEDPTRMPGPREIPGGDPADLAPPPGLVPPGDSRSLRRGGEFALVYRVHGAVICRAGAVGTRGQWRVVEYPTSAAAGNAYAQEVSRFVGEGFVDYRA